MATVTKLSLLRSPPPLHHHQHHFFHHNHHLLLRLNTPIPQHGRRASSIRSTLLQETIASATGHLVQNPIFATATSEGGVGYSPASYYTSLGLFVISVPGLWSLIKRSVKSKIVKKTLEIGAGGDEKKKEPKQMAGEILSFFTRNNFNVADRGETITFEGMMLPSRGQAALLTFCTCISLASVGLVLSIAIPEGGNNWFWLMALSPLA